MYIFIFLLFIKLPCVCYSAKGCSFHHLYLSFCFSNFFDVHVAKNGDSYNIVQNIFVFSRHVCLYYIDYFTCCFCSCQYFYYLFILLIKLHKKTAYYLKLSCFWIIIVLYMFRHSTLLLKGHLKLKVFDHLQLVFHYSKYNTHPYC